MARTETETNRLPQRQQPTSILFMHFWHIEKTMTRAVVFVLFLVRVSGGRRVGSLKSGGLYVCVLFVARLREHALHSSVAIALHWVGG